ncbi:phosphatidylinositol phospholipase [Leptospira sp. SA-E8]|uniref:phosphatidylinositol phospholipase n=1 Tax=Leptospira sp. SA-E8 TaxID=3422259 RepID=UPI003EB78628
MAVKIKRTSFQRLLNAMKKVTSEVNDHEILRRLETLMVTSKEDLNQAVVRSLLENPLDFDPKSVPEPYAQYVRHFVYMVKRNKKMGLDVNFDASAIDSKKEKKKLTAPKKSAPAKKQAPARKRA